MRTHLALAAAFASRGGEVHTLTRVAPGATYEAEIGGAGTQRFECCIHPWMRTTVRVQ